MWPVLVHLGKGQISWWILFLIITPIWCSFTMWKRLKEDYPDEEIFSCNFWLLITTIFGAVAGGWAEWGKLGAISGWGMIMGAMGALWLWCSKKKWDFWEMTDFLALMALWVWLFGSLAWGPGAKWGMIFAAIGIVLISLVKNNYKKIKWYKSGKVGLTGLAGVLYFSATQICVAMLTPVRVYWGGLTLSQWVSAWAAAFTLVGIYIRADRKLKEEPLILLFNKKHE